MKEDIDLERVRILKERIELLFNEFTCDNPESIRWLSIAKTHFQQGMMALNKSKIDSESF